jgi:hypothetical protein
MALWDPSRKNPQVSCPRHVNEYIPHHI